MSTEPLPPSAAIRRREHLQTAASVCALTVIAVASLAFLSWFLPAREREQLFPGGITIKTNTAIALIAGGVATLFAVPRHGRKTRIRVTRIAAVVTFAIGILTFGEHVTGWDIGIDQLLFHEPPGSAATASPNRMGPPASLSLALLGAALLLADTHTRAARRVAEAMRLFTGLLATIALVGYVYQVPVLFGVSRYSGIAFPTAASIALLAAAGLFARPWHGVVRQLTSEDSGGALARRLLPVALVLPIALAWIEQVGEHRRAYGSDFGSSMLVLGTMVTFSAFILWTSAAVSRQSRAREAAESAQLELNRRIQEERLELLRRERAAREQAEHSNRMKDEFLATLSHELRTPLNSILGWASVLSRGVGPDDTRRGLQAIERNAALQARLIEDLLDMSRIVSGKLLLDLQDVDLALVVENVLAAIAPAAEARGVQVGRELPAEPVRVRGDAARLQQVLWNLASNAVKFTSRGGRVDVALACAESRVSIRVTDTGIGIRPEFLPLVFDRFRQADASSTRLYGGLGLGLSIARQLTELHGGTLEATSAGEGHGATFTVTLPVAAVAWPAEHDPRPTSGAWVEEDGLPPSLDGVRVLVVDDEADARDLLSRVLSECGAVVVTAEGMSSALHELSAAGFDVLVSDIAMPGADGYALIREVRTRRLEVPALALTAFARGEDRERALMAGYHDHLAKPVTPRRLAAAVARLAAGARRA